MAYFVVHAVRACACGILCRKENEREAVLLHNLLRRNKFKIFDNFGTRKLFENSIIIVTIRLVTDILYNKCTIYQRSMIVDFQSTAFYVVRILKKRATYFEFLPILRRHISINRLSSSGYMNRLANTTYLHLSVH